MIKIINGVFGYNNGKTIIPKTSKDEPFECDAKVEKRLVAQGVAVYVGNGKCDQTEPKTKTEVKEPTRKELIATFKEMGLKGNPNSMKTEDLKTKIAEAAELVEDEEVGTDEGAPTFEEDGVVG